MPLVFARFRIGPSNCRDRRLRTGLGILQVFIGLGGAAGGLGLVLDPTGGNLTMPTESLANSPFSDFLVPGLVLLAVNGVGNLIGGMTSFAGWRRCGDVAVALGAFLMAWIVAQVWWIGLIHGLQPLYFCLGVLQLALGIRQRCAGHGVTGAESPPEDTATEPGTTRM